VVDVGSECTDRITRRHHVGDAERAQQVDGARVDCLSGQPGGSRREACPVHRVEHRFCSQQLRFELRLEPGGSVRRSVGGPEGADEHLVVGQLRAQLFQQLRVCLVTRAHETVEQLAAQPHADRRIVGLAIQQVAQVAQLFAFVFAHDDAAVGLQGRVAVDRGDEHDGQRGVVARGDHVHEEGRLRHEAVRASERHAQRAQSFAYDAQESGARCRRGGKVEPVRALAAQRHLAERRASDRECRLDLDGRTSEQGCDSVSRGDGCAEFHDGRGGGVDEQGRDVGVRRRSNREDQSVAGAQREIGSEQFETVINRARR